MSPTLNLILSFAVGLPTAIVCMLETGWRLGCRWRARSSEPRHAGMATVEASVFGLMGLLIAFTFYGAAARYDRHRELIGMEANAIGTAWLRLDLLPPADQPNLRDLFRRYLDLRVAAFHALPNAEVWQADVQRAETLQAQIWKLAVDAAQRAGPNSDAAERLVLPALNDMFDITTTRRVALETHPPDVIDGMLIAVVFAAALFAGFAMSESCRRSWLHFIAFALMTSFTIYVIFDLEYPRAGAIRIDPADRVLYELRNKWR